MAGTDYQMMFRINAQLQGQFNAAFKGAAGSVSTLQSQIDSLNKKQGDITAYQKQQAAVERTQSKLQLLKAQYENLRAEMGANGEASATLKNQMLAKEQQIERTSAALEGQTGKLENMKTALEGAGVDTTNLAAESASLSTQISSLTSEQEKLAAATQEASDQTQSAADTMLELQSALGVMETLKKGYEVLRECSRSSIEFESSMAAVKRTVGGSDSFISGLGDEFKELSTVIPITSGEFAEIAMTAGQLGIAQANVESFAVTMAKLGTTTDLTAGEAATMLAQFANITGLTEYDRMGAVVADLGDATATTATKVVEMSQGMAAAASQAGMAPTDIMGISAAVASLGIESQAGSTAMSTLIMSLYKAVETGKGLEDYAAIAGMTADQFRVAWGQNAAGALDTFIRGLDNVEQNGRSAVVILDELGITNVRQTKAILGLASAGNLLTNTVNQANRAWQQNTALNDKASIMYTTTEAKLTMMGNAANNVKIAIGDSLTPVMGGFAVAATSILQPVSEWIAMNPALVRGIVAAGAVIGGVTLAMSAFSVAATVAAKASVVLAASIPGLNIILGVTAGVALLAGGIVALSSVIGDTSNSFSELDEQFDHINEQIEEQQNIIDLVDEYRKLSRELGYAKKAVNELGDADGVDITFNATVAAQLKPEDFVDGTHVALSADQANKLAAMDFVPDGTTITLTAASGNSLAAAGFLDGTEVELTAAAYNELKASGFLDSTDVKLDAEAGDTISSDDMVDSTKVELTAEMANHLAATGYLDGTQVALTAEMANHLNAEGFLEGSEVELSAMAANTLAPTGFLDGEKVAITASAANTLTSAGYLDSTSVAITGTNENTMDPTDFVTDTTIAFVGEITNLADLQAKANALQAQLQSVGQDLSAAQNELSGMEETRDQLNARYDGTTDVKAKSKIEQQMADVDEAIVKQRTKVDRLQKKWDDLNDEYEETQTAAYELAEKEARLAEVKETLTTASGGVITATSNETEAFAEQAGVLEALAKSRQAELRQASYDLMVQQSKAYTDSIASEVANQERLNAAVEKQSRYQELCSMTADQLEGELRNIYTSLSDLA